jgi:hypothetical protein
MHYNTFDLIKIDSKEAVTKFENSGKELILFDIGEVKKLECSYQVTGNSEY